MEDKIRISCSVCQASLRVRAATKARFAICPKCQARTPIPDREKVSIEITSPMPEPAPTLPSEPTPAPTPDKEFTRADLAPVTEKNPAPANGNSNDAPTPPAGTPTMEEAPPAPAADQAPTPAPQEAPPAEEKAPAKPATARGALPGRKPGTRPLPGKRSSLPGKRGKDGEEGAVGAEKKGGSKMVLWIVVFLVVLGGGGAGLYFSGMLDSMMGKGGGPSAGPTSDNLNKLVAAANSRNVDSFVKLVKDAGDKYKDDLKKLYDDLDQYKVTAKVVKVEGNKVSAEWFVEYKVKASPDPGGDMNPQPKKTEPSTDDFVFEADGTITFGNLPTGFPVPKH